MFSSYTRILPVDDPVAEFGNCWGHIALWSSSLFLWSVVRRRPLRWWWAWCNTNNNNVLFYQHIWPGRIIIVASMMHGGVHLYRWKFLLGFQWLDQILPNWDCWRNEILMTTTTTTTSSTTTTTTPSWILPRPVSPDTCHSIDITGCTCYDILRNAFGCFALMGIIVIAITSWHVIRRRWYSIFYTTHILVAPMILIFMCLHFTRSIIYIAPSLLYYMACSVPEWIETTSNQLQSPNGVRILAYERICDSMTVNGEGKESRHRPCISMIVEASDSAMRCYHPGQHIRLHVPSISRVSHPFTVNPVIGQSNQLRILFRESGDFTVRLGKALQLGTTSGHSGKSHDTNPPAVPPAIYMKGYYGSTCRLSDAKKHETIVILVGGIGIVAYLSLMEAVLSTPTLGIPKRIELHWICRETSLVEFVHREYLDPIRNKALNNIIMSKAYLYMTIYLSNGDNIHQRSGLTTPKGQTVTAEGTSSCEEDGKATRHKSGSTSQQPVGDKPFTHLTFAAGVTDSNHRAGMCEKILIYGILNGCVGPLVIWYACSNALHENDPAATVWSWVCIWAIIGAVVWSAFTLDARSFAAVSSIMWWGLFAIWYIYLNLQDEFSRIRVRLVNPLATMAISTVVAVLYHCFSKFGCVETEYSLLGTTDRSDETEMVEVSTFQGQQMLDRSPDTHIPGDGVSTNGISEVEIVHGRPRIWDIIQTLDGNDVGIFSCGPESFMSDVRSAASKWRQCKGFICNTDDGIALYEESFVL